MGKGDRRGKAKRNKAAFEMAVALAPIPPRAKQGRERMAEIAVERAPQRQQLEVRALAMGKKRGDWEDMASPALGEAAGRALLLFAGGDAEKSVWPVYAALTRSYTAYLRATVGLTTSAKTAKLEYMPEAFETRPDDRPDLRTEDERHRDAVNSWAFWSGLLKRLTLAERSRISAVQFGWSEPVKDGRLTPSGNAFCAAMQKVAEMSLERA